MRTAQRRSSPDESGLKWTDSGFTLNRFEDETCQFVVAVESSFEIFEVIGVYASHVQVAWAVFPTQQHDRKDRTLGRALLLASESVSVTSQLF